MESLFLSINLSSSREKQIKLSSRNYLWHLLYRIQHQPLEKAVAKILQTSQGNNYNFSLINYKFNKKDPPVQMFSCGFQENFKKYLTCRHLGTVSFDKSNSEKFSKICRKEPALNRGLKLNLNMHD